MVPPRLHQPAIPSNFLTGWFVLFVNRRCTLHEQDDPLIREALDKGKVLYERSRQRMGGKSRGRFPHDEAGVWLRNVGTQVARASRPCRQRD